MKNYFNENLKIVPAQIALAYAVVSDPEQNYILVSPTGSGKTEIAYMIAAARAQNGKKTLILEPNQRLVMQAFERAEKYGLNESLQININPTAQGIYGAWETNTVFGRDDFGYYRRKDFAAREERRIKRDITGWKRGNFIDAKKKAYYDSEIMISTNQLIKSDLARMRERMLNDEVVKSFDTIIVDEVPDFVAYEQSNEDDRQEEVNYRVSKFYDELFKKTGSKSQIIGLTAFPGKKAKSLESMLDAKIIKPEHELVAQFIPNTTYYPIECEDNLVSELHEKMNANLINRKHGLAKLLNQRIKGADYDYTRLTFAALTNFASSKDRDIAASAAGIMKLSHVMQMLLESTYYFFGSALDLGDEQISTLTYIEKNSGMSASSIESELTERARNRMNLRKVDELIPIVGSSDKVVIAANYVRPIMEIDKLFKKTKINSDFLIGGSEQSTEDQMKIIKRFNEGDLQLLVTNFLAGGYGLDLWAGTAMVYMGMPVTVERAVQMKGRITRQKGITEIPKDISVYPMVYTKTPDVTLQENVKDIAYSDWPGRTVGFDEEMLKEILTGTNNENAD